MAANTLAMRLPGGVVSAALFATAAGGAAGCGVVAFGAPVAGVRAALVGGTVPGAACGCGTLVGALAGTAVATCFEAAGAGDEAVRTESRPAGAVRDATEDVEDVEDAEDAAVVVAGAAGEPGAAGALSVRVAVVFVAVPSTTRFALAARRATGALFGVRTITIPVAIPMLNPNAATNGINRRFIMSPAACIG